MMHELKLRILRNKMSILTWIGFFLLTSVLVLQVILIREIVKQTQKNEEILQGLSCVLLIEPKDRTKQNVGECVEGNAPKRPSFQFKTEEEIKKERVEPAPTNEIQFNQVVEPPQKASVEKQPEAKKEQQLPPIEKRTNEDGTMWYRYEGDTEWSLCTEDICG